MSTQPSTTTPTLGSRKRSSSPSSPQPSKRQNTGAASSSPSFRYPSTPSSSRTTSFLSSDPVDTPSNPFGRTNAWNRLQVLPPPTSFGKHLPLRFQLIRRGVPRQSIEGVFRIVQVPQSYTLVHLKSLLDFLFGGAYGQIPADMDDGEDRRYLFELKKDVKMLSSGFKPGQMKSATTWAYSSTILDPFLYSSNDDDASVAIVDGEEFADDATDEDRDTEKKPHTNRWMAEEDVTIAHVWPAGGETSRGIVYSHSQTLQVHITVNASPIAPRRGRGNLPHVFSARGLAYLEPLGDDERDLEEEDETALLDPSNWNDPENAFETWYHNHTSIPYAGFEKQADARFQESTPSSLLLSSPSHPSSSSSTVPSSPSIMFPLIPSDFPKYTPAPRPAQRKRLGQLEHHLGALTEQVKKHTQAEREKERTKAARKSSIPRKRERARSAEL